jgi:hypothetical protein
VTNSFEATARRNKAERFAHRLFEADISSEEASTLMTPAAWAGVASALGFSKSPSPETQAMVIEILREKEAECQHSKR